MNIIGYTKAKIDSLIATKADLVNGDVPDAQLPDRLQDVALRAALEARVSRAGATTGQVPTLQGDGSLVFATIGGGYDGGTL